jgi:hypothetical protein
MAKRAGLERNRLGCFFSSRFALIASEDACAPVILKLDIPKDFA